MKVENIGLSELKPLETNVRRHSEKQIEELIRSVEQFGQTRAIVIDENNEILIGNGLYYALERMGTAEAQVYRITGLSDIEKKKLVLSDNKIFALGSDDYDGINSFVAEITQSGDFDIAGFDTYTLEMLTIDEDEAEQDMRQYGTVTDESLVNTEQPNTGNISQPIQNGSQAAQNHENTSNGENVVEPPNGVMRRSVVCPNCGEVIYID